MVKWVPAIFNEKWQYDKTFYLEKKTFLNKNVNIFGKYSLRTFQWNVHDAKSEFCLQLFL